MEVRVLLVDHRPQNIEVLKKLLETAGHTVETIGAMEEMGERLHDALFDVALVNTSTEFIELAKVCERLRISDANRDSAVVFVAQEYDIEELDRCFDAGGSDYVAKPINPDELLKRVGYHAALKQRVQQLRDRCDKLASIATVDPLTKISSRIHLQTLLTQQIELFRRYREPVTVIYMRILELNRVNALMGYGKGDQLIVHFVKLFKDGIRASDGFGRWIGGDFVLVLPKTDAPSAMVLAKKMQGVLTRDERFAKFSIRFSFGITEVMEDDSVSGLVERSRSAMQRVVDDEYERIAVH